MGNQADEEVTARRVIKRYSNRKLYDTKDSRYVTLLQIAEMVRQGEDVQIIDNTTKEDKTDVTLALAISEELKARPKSVPLATLRQLIQARGEKLLTTLRDGPIGRLMPVGEESESTQEQDQSEEGATEQGKKEDDPKEGKKAERKDLLGLGELVATSRHTLDQWQHAIDERIRAVLPNFGLFRDIQRDIRHLSRRLERVEQALGLEALDRAPESERAHSGPNVEDHSSEHPGAKTTPE